jgi:two-component system copper resistance phosphate regulon response regulator CusR
MPFFDNYARSQKGAGNKTMVGEKTKQRKILLVEDDDGIVRMLLLSLRSNGFETARAESGREALKAMDEANYDAVILDLCLPDGRGGDVLRRLQSTGHRTPWIVMSALDEEDAEERFGPLQSPFLAKPFDLWDLIRLLDRLVGERPGGQADVAKAAS